jgi:hypothetical protein
MGFRGLWRMGFSIVGHSILLLLLLLDQHRRLGLLRWVVVSTDGFGSDGFDRHRSFLHEIGGDRRPLHRLAPQAPCLALSQRSNRDFFGFSCYFFPSFHLTQLLFSLSFLCLANGEEMKMRFG